MAGRLKEKDKVHYRRAKKGDSRCRNCVHSRYIEVFGIGESSLGRQWRCELFGVYSGVRYRINPDCFCDEWKACLKGGE